MIRLFKAASFLLLAFVLFNAAGVACILGDDFDENLGVAAVRSSPHVGAKRLAEVPKRTVATFTNIAQISRRAEASSLLTHETTASAKVGSQPITAPLRT